MEVKLEIPFQQLIKIVRQLSPNEKAKLQKELNAPSNKSSLKDTSLTEFLLNGPVLSKEQIKTIQETRKSINAWRTKS
jgi:hypothetical protein